VERLLQAGHRRLGYALPHDERLVEASMGRLAALRRACAEHGLAEPVALRVPAQPAGAAEAVSAWRELSPRVTGICAHDDVAALAVLAGLRAHNWSAPDDLAVIGVGDSPAAELADPPLTMVAVDWQATAAHVVGVVTGLLEGRSAPPGPDVATVIERQSI
jgi:DNA-binding LacI/PurR family transcriptional regulator